MNLADEDTRVHNVQQNITGPCKIVLKHDNANLVITC